MRRFRLLFSMAGIAAGGLLAVSPVAGQGEAPPPEVRFILDEATGSPGETVDLHLSIFTQVELKSASFAMDFDERLLRIEEVERATSVVNPLPADESRAANFDNHDDVEGNQAVEGWINLEVRASERSMSLAIPVGQEVRLFRLRFRILPRAVRGFTPVVFTDIGPVELLDQTVTLTNAAETDGRAAPAAMFDVAGENLDAGGVHINIIGEVGFFLRGDANMDLDRDISDPIRTLIHLFQGELQLTCKDAADSNDDGKIDLSDPVFTLSRLFTGGDPFPDPNKLGPDPTPDALDCDS